jgi:hypothetical protein
MPTLVQNPATTPIPVQLSATEFHQFILPHLSMPKRGPKCKLGYHRVFHLILWVLYTGTQWKGLPVPKESDGKTAIPPSIKSAPGGRMTAHLRRPSSPVWGIWQRTTNSISASCMAMAPTRWPKKAVTVLASPATNTRRGRKSSRSSTTTALCWFPCRLRRSMKRRWCCSQRV